MNYVDNFNLFGIDAKQIPCDTGEGAPTTATVGAVGCFYMNTLTGDVYKCVSAAGGVYTWELFGSGSSDAVQFVPQTLTEEQKAQARENIGAADVEAVSQIAEKTSGQKIIESINMLTLDMASPKGEWWYNGVKYTEGNAKTDASCSFRVNVLPNTTYYTALYNTSDLTYQKNSSVLYYNIFDAKGVCVQSASATYDVRSFVTPENASYAILTYQMYASASDAEPSYLPYLSIENPPATYTTVIVEPITFASLQADINALKGRGKPILHLPEKYDLVVGDTFELFYKGVMLCKDPYAYNILVTCPVGNAYGRKYVFTPTGAGAHTMKIQVMSDTGEELDSKSVQLVVSPKMATPASNINVLCLGDSLTAGGVWVDEVYRRLTKTTSVTQYNATAPAGDGLSKITFVGKKTTQNGAGYEGVGGWTYSDYLNASKADNPFVYNGKVDFAAYCSALSINKIDQCYILLGWNTAGTTEANWKANTKALIDLLIAHNSAIKIVLIGLQIPAYDGLGYNYGASGVYTNYRGLQEYVFNVDKWNADITADYPNNVSSISIAGQFDTENNMPAANTALNIRNTTQIKQQNNGVHPDTPGYYQIADAVYRKFTADNA